VFRSNVPLKLVCISKPEMGVSPLLMVPVEIASCMYKVLSMISWFAI